MLPAGAGRHVPVGACSVGVDPGLDVISALTCAELDDANIGKAMDVERVFAGDRFDLGAVLANRQDDPAISRFFPARHQEVS